LIIDVTKIVDSYIPTLFFYELSLKPNIGFFEFESIIVVASNETSARRIGPHFVFGNGKWHDNEFFYESVQCSNFKHKHLLNCYAQCECKEFCKLTELEWANTPEDIIAKEMGIVTDANMGEGDVIAKKANRYYNY
jgi:hypothetical protein